MTTARQQLGLFDVLPPAPANEQRELAPSPSEAAQPQDSQTGDQLPLQPGHSVILTLEYRRLRLAADQSEAALSTQLSSLGGAFALLLQLGSPDAAKAQAEYARITEEMARLLGVPVDQVDATMARAQAERKAAEAREKAERKVSRAQPSPKDPPTAGRPASSGPASVGGRRTGRSKAAPGSSPGAEAAPPTRRLTDRQRELLAGFVVGPDNVARYARPGHVQDWSEVKAVWVALGGKWRTGKPGGFHFPEDTDAAEVLRLALASGEIFDPKAAGFFETPITLADRIAALGELTPGCRVLEPSAGKGRIALAARRACPEALISCVELMPAHRAELERLGFELIGQDFLSLEPRPEFDAVLMNPTFNKRGDIHHTRRAWGWLKPSGRLVSVTSASVQFRQDALATEFRAWVKACGGEIENLPEGTFIESGTGVATALVTMRKGAR